MKLAMIASLLVAITVCETKAREYGGHDCTDDCSGHAEGYMWAEAHGITDVANCPLRRGASSFYEGCLVYVDDPNRVPDEDDDGDEIN